tara:strand:- start:3005 stop:4627 length:1623 start_codon:yes stop_codon:yes gene_type:complete
LVNIKKLSSKVLGVLMVFVAALGLIAALTINNLSSHVDQYSDLLEREVKAALLIDTVNLTFKRQVQEWKNVLLRGKDSQKREKYWNSFSARHKEIEQQLTVLKSIDVSAQVREQLNDFASVHSTLYDKYQLGYQAFINSGYDPYIGDEAVAGIDRAPTKLLETLSAQISSQVIAQNESKNSQVSSSLWWGSVSLISTIVLGFALLLWCLKALVTSPLHKLSEHIHAVSQGRLASPLMFERQDEIGQMAQSVETLRVDLLEIHSGLGSTQQDLDRVCFSLVDSAGAISQGVTEQNHGTASVQEAVDQLSQVAQIIEQHVHHAADSATTASRSAVTSIEVMQQTIETISGSSKQIEDTAKVISALNEDARKIGTVLDVIQGIAEQTNLLALNAAIEAARAGEHGRGFAVVADEVRTLAAKTQQSTEEIKQMIANVQQGTSDAVNAISQGQDQTKFSVDKVLEADGNLKGVTNAIEDIAAVNQHIVEAIAQQNNVTQDILRHLSELSQIAKLNGEHAQSCDEDNLTLMDVKDRMAGIIKKFVQ